MSFASESGYCRAFMRYAVDAHARATVSYTGTHLDKRPHISYISPRISLTEGRIPVAIRNVERVRCFRAGSQPAPERLWASFSSALRPKREVLSLELGLERAGNARPARSQEAWPEAEPGCESPGESRSGAPEGERAPTFGARPRPGIGRRQRLSMRRGPWLDAPFGAPLPSLFFGAAEFLALASWLAKLGRVRAARTGFHCRHCGP